MNSYTSISYSAWAQEAPILFARKRLSDLRCEEKCKGSTIKFIDQLMQPYSKGVKQPHDLNWYSHPLNNPSKYMYWLEKLTKMTGKKRQTMAGRQQKVWRLGNIQKCNLKNTWWGDLTRCHVSVLFSFKISPTVNIALPVFFPTSHEIKLRNHPQFICCPE